MKTVFIKMMAPLAAVATLLAAMPAQSQVFHTVRSLLGEHFRSSSAVGFERVQLSGAERAAVERQLGARLPKSEYVFYVARTGDRVDGYALFDEERGQHELIDFATFFDPAGNVTRVEVVAYREAYGDGIRAERFRRQFVGRNAESGFRSGHDVDAISGATLSSRSMARVVQRGAVLLRHTLLARSGALAAR